MIGFVVAVAGIVVGYAQLLPPKAPLRGSEDYYDYSMMLSNVERLAQAPHPSGSDELAGIRRLILDEISGMGLAPVVEREIYTLSDFLDRDMAYWNGTREDLEEYYTKELDKLEYTLFDEKGELELFNIFAKLDAPDSEKGVLFVSHYDSTPGGPGAADDMVAVCALLEAMLDQAGKPRINSLYFLITDGEELGLLGARRFIESHPELRDKIELVVNFEARGNSGGLLMFETSVNDYTIVKQYKKQNLHPISFSMAPAVYRLMPNGTDLSEFLQAGYRGMNFAAIGGSEHYHMPTDDFEHLDKDTAWHYLLTAKAFADMAAFMDLSRLDANDDGVYFPFFPGRLVIMTATFARVVAGALFVMSVLWIVWTLRRGKANTPKPARFLRHSLWYPLVVMAVVLFVMPSLLGIFGLAVFSMLASALCYELTSSSRFRPLIMALLYALLGFSLFVVCVPCVVVLYMALYLPSLIVGVPIGLLPVLYLSFAGLGIHTDEKTQGLQLSASHDVARYE